MGIAFKVIGIGGKIERKENESKEILRKSLYEWQFGGDQVCSLTFEVDLQLLLTTQTQY